MRPHADLLTTRSTARGLELARAYQPDLVLLGVSDSAHQSGDLLRQLQADERLRHVPAIAIAPDGCASEWVGTSVAGCAEVLTKPLEVLRFLDVMDRLMPKPA